MDTTIYHLKTEQQKIISITMSENDAKNSHFHQIGEQL